MNLYANDWDVERESSEGVPARLLHVGHRLGSQLIGGTVMEVGPGYRGPYHLHHANEELALVLDGCLTVRDPRGERALTAGEVAFFPRGEEGLHALENRSSESVRFVLLS